jgi:Ca-activated chloride channel family protein
MLAEPLYLLGALPLLALAAAAYAWGASRRRALTALLGDEPTLARLMRPEAAGRRRLQSGLRLAALALLMLALARPQWGVEAVETAATGRDVVIAVDVSLSMLTEDVKPNRFARAREELSLLIDELKGSRVGIVAFAGEPVVVCPLTTDTAAAKQLLRVLSPGAVPVPGSAIGKALRAATAMLARYPGSRSIILLTDGEDHKSRPVEAAEEAAAEGIRIDAIGIGTREGEPIPLKDENGAVSGYKKDKRGGTVMSRLGERDLSEIASKTGGNYYRSSPGASEASEIARKLLDGPGVDGERRGTGRRYKSRHMIPLALAFLLLLLEAFLPETRAGSPPMRSSAGAAAALGLLLLASPSSVSAATAEGALRRGNRHYDNEQYEPALEQYARAGARSPKDTRPVFNAGDAHYRMKQYQRAAEAFKAVAEAGAPAARPAAYYNLGNALYAQQDYAGAVAAYRKAVALNPADEEGRRNLAVALRKLKDPSTKKPNKDGPPKNPDDPKKPNDQGQPKNEDGKNGGQQQSPPPQPKTRPQDQLTKEDAERVRRAVSERERAADRQQLQRAPIKRPEAEEDW